MPIVKNNSNQKMEEGEVYAIETFASTGKGYVWEEGDCSHYMRDFEKDQASIKHPKGKQLLKLINDNFSTLAFCRFLMEPFLIVDAG